MRVKDKSYLFILIILILTCFVMACSNDVSVKPIPLRPPETGNTPSGSSEIQRYTNTNDKDDSWNTEASFSGVSDEVTPEFYITGEKWRLTWMIETELPEHSVFSIYVYSADKTSIPIKVVSSSTTNYTDTVYFQEGGSSYYLKIIAANLKGWNIEVEDHVKEHDLPPVQIVEIHYKGTVFEPEECMCFERIEPDEYVVVKNMSDEWVDIRDWKLINITRDISRESNFRFTFPDYFSCCPDFFKQYFGSNFNCVPPMPCILAPHQSVLIYTDEFHPETGGLSFYYGSSEIWENDKPNIAVLYNAEGKEVSRKSYLIRSEKVLPPLIKITGIDYIGKIELPATDNVSMSRVVIDEYVEISNLSDDFQNMGGWSLKNETKGHPVFVFPIDYSIGPQEKVLVYTHEVHTPGDFSYYDSSHDIWDNEEPDTAVLYNLKGEEVSRKSYLIIK